jgi:hypothetical protein
MLKVKTKWTGFTGGPGYTNFFFSLDNDGFMTQELADAAATKTETFFNQVASLFPAVVKSTVQSDVEEIDEATGALTNLWTVATRTGTAGTNVGNNYSGPAGMVVTWRTSTVRAGRLMRGRTFLVPTALQTFDTDGTIISSYIDTVSTAAAALRADDLNLDFGVYARPKKDAGGTVTLAGNWAPVTGHTVPDKVAVLRSRRD